MPLTRKSLVSGIPAGDGKIDNFFFTVMYQALIRLCYLCHLISVLPVLCHLLSCLMCDVLYLLNYLVCSVFLSCLTRSEPPLPPLHCLLLCALSQLPRLFCASSRCVLLVLRFYLIYVSTSYINICSVLQYLFSCFAYSLTFLSCLH
jgi:hypothetical protein